MSDILARCAQAALAAIVAREAEIEGLDRAIGDGDHYINIRRGAETAVTLCTEMAGEPANTVLKMLGMKLLSTIGGASGPLTASFFLAAGKVEPAEGALTQAVVAQMVSDGVAAIKARGKADVGAKTMLDTLVPAAQALTEGAGSSEPAELRAKLRAAAEAGMRSTKDMTAKFGRAAFLGERAVGHIDPGAMSSFVIIAAICDMLEADEGG
ncbi:MAG: dihydroxyacetone kinase subunit DhaL [Pseudomonadota bacterium]